MLFKKCYEMFTLTGSLEQLWIGVGLNAVLLGAGGSHQYDQVPSTRFEVSKRKVIVRGKCSAEPRRSNVVLLLVFNVEQTGRIHLVACGPCQVKTVLERGQNEEVRLRRLWLERR